MSTGMFDSMIEAVAGRSGLGADKAKQLIGALISMIFNEKSGGFAGFTKLFQDKGLGNLVQSWTGTGTNEAISSAQVESVFGAPLIGALASKLGVDQTTTAGAISQLLPGVVNELSPNGQAPTGLPETLKGWISGLGEWLGDLGGLGWGALAGGAAAVVGGVSALGGAVAGGASAAGSAVLGGASAVGGAVADGASAVTGAVGGAVSGGAKLVGNAAEATVDATRSIFGKLLPFLLLAALVIGGLFLFKSCQKHDVVAPIADAAAPIAEVVEAPIAAVVSALDSLKPDATVEELIAALNLAGIEFDTGKATITANSLVTLEKAAAAIKRAPAGTKIEVGGYTDNTGDAAANLTLSEARASAVQSKLAELGVDATTLSAKGYGQEKPVADNATEEGRAKNRRMEFAVVQ